MKWLSTLNHGGDFDSVATETELLIVAPRHREGILMFKVVFEVRDEQANIVVEKSQLWLEVSKQELQQESKLEASSRILAEVRDGGDPELLKQVPDKDWPEEATMAAGIMIGKFILIKLREWSRG